jgi:hypothetical protein
MALAKNSVHGYHDARVVVYGDRCQAKLLSVTPMALYECMAERLSAHFDTYPALSPDHDSKGQTHQPPNLALFLSRKLNLA